MYENFVLAQKKSMAIGSSACNKLGSDAEKYKEWCEIPEIQMHGTGFTG